MTPAPIPCLRVGETPHWTPWRPPAGAGRASGFASAPSTWLRAGGIAGGASNSLPPMNSAVACRQRLVDRPGHGPGTTPGDPADEPTTSLDVAVGAQGDGRDSTDSAAKAAAPLLLNQPRPGDAPAHWCEQSPWLDSGAAWSKQAPFAQRLLNRNPRALDTPAGRPGGAGGAPPGSAGRAVALLKRAPSAVA